MWVEPALNFFLFKNRFFGPLVTTDEDEEEENEEYQGAAMASEDIALL